MKKIAVAFAILAATTFLAAIALAQTTPAPAPEELTPAADFFTWGVRMGTIVGSALVGWLVLKAIHFVEAKLKVDIPAAFETTLMSFAAQGVALAEERAHKYAKEAGQKMTGSQKMIVALDFMRDLAKQHKLDIIAEEKLRLYIEAKLGETRT